jgi:hypothetical protein
VNEPVWLDARAVLIVHDEMLATLAARPACVTPGFLKAA